MAAIDVASTAITKINLEYLISGYSSSSTSKYFAYLILSSTHTPLLKLNPKVHAWQTLFEQI